MAGCSLTGLRRLSSSGQPSHGEPGLRRSTSCGALFSAGGPPGDPGKRDLLLGVVSLPVTAAWSNVCMSSAKPGTGEPEPVAGIPGLEQNANSSEDNIIILLDAMACMSTLYGHTCQHLREVCEHAICARNKPVTPSVMLYCAGQHIANIMWFN